jgi:deoxycytidylate deaminase
MLLNFQRFGKMKSMGKVVEWSIRDETMHVEGNSKLFKSFCSEHSRIVDNEFKSNIYNMAKSAVKLEDKFIDLAYELGTIEGLPAEDVKQYIRYITDRRLIQLGLKPIFKVKDNPLSWLEWILNAAHAEENAIANAARMGTSLDGCVIITTGLFPCTTCSRMLVQSGIRKVIAPPCPEGKWAEEEIISLQILEEGGVEVERIDMDV